MSPISATSHAARRVATWVNGDRSASAFLKGRGGALDDGALPFAQLLEALFVHLSVHVEVVFELFHTPLGRLEVLPDLVLLRLRFGVREGEPPAAYLDDHGVSGLKSCDVVDPSLSDRMVDAVGESHDSLADRLAPRLPDLAPVAAATMAHRAATGFKLARALLVPQPAASVAPRPEVLRFRLPLRPPIIGPLRDEGLDREPLGRGHAPRSGRWSPTAVSKLAQSPLFAGMVPVRRRRTDEHGNVLDSWEGYGEPLRDEKGEVVMCGKGAVETERWPARSSSAFRLVRVMADLRAFGHVLRLLPGAFAEDREDHAAALR